MRNESEIILCKGIKLDRNYENVLSYSESNMVTLCRNNAIYTGTNYKIVGVKNNIINVSASYSACIYANYIAFKNPLYGNKWFFAWVTDVKLLNPNTTQITFQVDVFSTWFDSFVVGQAFIEREHVEDDTVGLHLIPEGLDKGEYIVNSVAHDGFSGSTPVIIMATTIDPALDPQAGTPTNIGGNNGGGVYNGVKSGLKYYSYNLNSTTLPDYLEGFANAGQNDAINSLFMIPRAFITASASENLDDKAVPENNSPITYVWEISKQTTIDGYTPINNKLLTGEYNYLYLTNNNGFNAIYNYEFFTNSVDANLCQFVEHGAVCPGGSVFLYPRNYKRTYENISEGIPGAKYPICGWQSDTYTNWLTQNALSIKMGVIKSTGQIIGGLGTGMIGGSTEGYGMALGGINSIITQMVDWKQKQLIPNQAEGNTNTGDVLFAMNRARYSYYKMSITREYAVIIDRFFSRYGYKVNEVKTPNLASRSKFNYVKVGGLDELVHGDIPSNDLEEINSIFRKGVTIFHNYTDIGNYTISNPIVTP